MRSLRLAWNRVRPILCHLGWHRWETLYGGYPYTKSKTCVFCGRERG